MRRIKLHFWVLGGALTLLAEPAPAQDAASTLLRLTEASDSIAIATTTGAHNHSVTFEVQRRLRGALPRRFVLGEPAGRACGRALQSLAGGRYIVFLSTINGGPRLAVSSARSIVVAAPALSRHVEALLAAPAAATRTLLLGLDSSHPRVRDDAAISLVYRRDLETLGDMARDRVITALRRGLDHRTSAHLLLAASRLHATAAIEVLLPKYLAGDAAHLEPLLLEQLPRLGAAQLCSATAARLPDDRAGRDRACRVLEQLPIAAARAPLTEIFGDGRGPLAVRAGRALRALGTSEQWLRQHSAPAVLAAIHQTRAARPPAFRSISVSQP